MFDEFRVLEFFDVQLGGDGLFLGGDGLEGDLPRNAEGAGDDGARVGIAKDTIDGGDGVGAATEVERGGETRSGLILLLAPDLLSVAAGDRGEDLGCLEDAQALVGEIERSDHRVPGGVAQGGGEALLIGGLG